MLLGRVLPRVPFLIEREPGKLCAADDLEEDRLVFAGGRRVAGALDGVAEVLGGQRGAVAVLQSLSQVEGDLGGVVVVLPGFGGRRHCFLVRVEPGEALIGKGQDIDLVDERAFLGIDDVRIDWFMDTKNLSCVLRG